MSIAEAGGEVVVGGVGVGVKGRPVVTNSVLKVVTWPDENALVAGKLIHGGDSLRSLEVGIGDQTQTCGWRLV
jgi:hypothetical protein